MFAIYVRIYCNIFWVYVKLKLKTYPIYVTIHLSPYASATEYVSPILYKILLKNHSLFLFTLPFPLYCGGKLSRRMGTSHDYPLSRGLRTGALKNMMDRNKTHPFKKRTCAKNSKITFLVKVFIECLKKSCW